MHELSLAGAIIATAAKHADGRPVAVVSLRVGTLRQVVPDTLRFYFSSWPATASAKGPSLRSRSSRRGCAAGRAAIEWSIDIPHFRCPACGGSEVEIASGNEFEVESIEIEEVACIAPR